MLRTDFATWPEFTKGQLCSLIPDGALLMSGGGFSGNVIDDSCIFNDGDNPELSRTYTITAPWTLHVILKRGELGAENLILGASAGEVHFNSNDTLEVEGASSSAVFRDTTAWYFITISNNGVKVNGTEVIAGASVTTTDLTDAKLFDDFDGYVARCALIEGQTYDESDFTETDANGNIAPKSAAAIQALTWGADGTFFKDGTDLQAGTDTSGNGNTWTVTNLASGDVVNDSPTHNSDGTVGNWSILNSVHEDAAGTLSEGNLVVTGGSEHQVGTLALVTGAWTWEVTVDTTESQSHGVESATTGTESLYTASFTSGDVIQFRLDVDAGTLDRKLNAGSWTSVATGLTDTPYLPLVKGDCTVDFGQKGFAGTDAGASYKLINSKHIADTVAPTVTNPDDAFVQVTDTETNIASTLATARSGWSDYIDILKNLDSAETWAYRFSRDSGNEHAVATSNTYGTDRTLSGTDNWLGASIRVGSDYSVLAGEASHTNGGGNTTVTHNLGDARHGILLFSETATSEVIFYHPDFDSGELVNLTDAAAPAASTNITNIGANSFDIASAMGTATYHWLVLGESDFIRFVKRIGNANADGSVGSNGRGRPDLIWMVSDDANNHSVYSDVMEPNNIKDDRLLLSTDSAKNTGTTGISTMDFLSVGTKARGIDSIINGSGLKYWEVHFLQQGLDPNLASGQPRAV